MQNTMSWLLSMVVATPLLLGVATLLLRLLAVEALLVAPPTASAAGSGSTTGGVPTVPTAGGGSPTGGVPTA